MRRRAFLKLMGMTGAALYFDPVALLERSAYSHFDPKLEYGEFIQVADVFNRPIINECMDIMNEQIMDTIPKRYRRRIKYMLLEPGPTAGDPLSQLGYAIWKYSPKYTKLTIELHNSKRELQKRNEGTLKGV